MKHVKTITVGKAATNPLEGLMGFVGDAWEQVSALLKK
jgi:hypothetical protein